MIPWCWSADRAPNQACEHSLDWWNWGNVGKKDVVIDEFVMDVYLTEALSSIILQPPHTA
jgi:hypothetical protein